MQYSEIDSRGACALYISETYGEAVVHQLPSVLDTVWDCVLFRFTEDMAHLEIFSIHRLVPAEKK